MAGSTASNPFSTGHGSTEAVESSPDAEAFAVLIPRCQGSYLGRCSRGHFLEAGRSRHCPRPLCFSLSFPQGDLLRGSYSLLCLSEGGVYDVLVPVGDAVVPAPAGGDGRLSERWGDSAQRESNSHQTPSAVICSLISCVLRSLIGCRCASSHWSSHQFYPRFCPNASWILISFICRCLISSFPSGMRYLRTSECKCKPRAPRLVTQRSYLDT